MALKQLLDFELELGLVRGEGLVHREGLGHREGCRLVLAMMQSLVCNHSLRR